MKKLLIYNRLLIRDHSSFYIFITLIMSALLTNSLQLAAQHIPTINKDLNKLIEGKKYKEAVNLYEENKDHVFSTEKELFIEFHQLGAKVYIAKGIRDYEKSNQIYSLLKDSIDYDERRRHWGAKIVHNTAKMEKDHDEKVRLYEDLVKNLPGDHIDLGYTYQLLSAEYKRYLRDYEQYEQYCEKAKKAYRSSHGKDSYEYLRSLNFLGDAYSIRGKLTKAKKEWENGLNGNESNSERTDRDDLQFSKIANNLADLYRAFNEYGKSESLFQRSLNIKSKHGKNADYAKTLINYAILLNQLDRHEEALNKTNECIKIAQDGKEREDELNYLQLKAGILVDLDSIDLAIDIYENLIKTRENTKQEKDPNHSKVLFNLYKLYFEKGNLEKASRLIEEVIKQFSELHGEEHPYYAKAIRNKADLVLEKGGQLNFDSIYTLSNEIIEDAYRSKKHKSYFESEFAYFLYLKKTEQDKRAIDKLVELDKIIRKYIEKIAFFVPPVEITNLYRAYYQEMVSLASRSSNMNNRKLQRLVFNSSLFYKGFILEKVLTIQRAIRGSEKLGDFSARLKQLTIQLDEQIQQGNSKEISDTRQTIDKLETDLGKELRIFFDEEIDVEEIHYKLEDTEIAIDFIRYYERENNTYLYAAQILTSEEDQPVFVPLFEESEFTSEFNKNIDSKELASLLYDDPDRNVTPGRKGKKISLNQLVWKKLVPHLGDANKIYYSADGILNTIAFHAIRLDDLDKVVATDYQLVQMTSLRNLASTSDTDFSFSKALLIGGVDYEGEALAEVRSGKNLHWDDLSHSSIEVDSINNLLEKKNIQVEILKEHQPKKKLVQSLLRQEKEWRLVHFATHGYFETDSLLGVRSTIEQNLTDVDLTRSALVLADANMEGEDAYLTAYEISECDLSKTQLVVLSACETGLGQIYENEGVYGLQRAFKIAGVEYVIMSLWTVGDANARRFMETFYNYYLEDKVSVEDAFYQTQTELLHATGIGWAGFVLLK